MKFVIQEMKAESDYIRNSSFDLCIAKLENVYLNTIANFVIIAAKKLVSSMSQKDIPS